jgi:hypothetical protein
MGKLALAALLAATGCATGVTPIAAPPASFHAVRSLALVRSVDDRAGRPKDPLDGLDETLRSRGYETRVIELGPKRNADLAAVERLFGLLELRAAAGRAERLGTAPFADVGRAAGETVDALGVDAVASYHRLDRHRLPPRPAEPVLPGTVFPQPAAPSPGPVGALALVDRSGHLATFPWGEASALEDPAVPLNAAEAIDFLVRALAGESPPDE